MDTYNKLGGSILEFEQFPGRADIQISKVLNTSNGDQIRAILTTGGSIMLTGVGRPNDNVVILTGELGSWQDNPDVCARWWDVGLKVAEALLREINTRGDRGGSSCKTTTTVTTTTDSNGNTSTTTTTTATCHAS